MNCRLSSHWIITHSLKINELDLCQLRTFRNAANLIKYDSFCMCTCMKQQSPHKNFYLYRKYLQVYDYVYEHGDELTLLSVVITWGKLSLREVVDGGKPPLTRSLSTHTHPLFQRKRVSMIKQCLTYPIYVKYMHIYDIKIVTKR